jgi:hypothetical protein
VPLCVTPEKILPQEEKSAFVNAVFLYEDVAKQKENHRPATVGGFLR